MEKEENEKIIEEFLANKRAIRPIINPDSTALLVVDMQDYQISPNSSIAKFFEKINPGILKYYCERVQNIVIPNLKEILSFFRKYSLPIFFTRLVSMREDGKDLNPNYKKLNDLAIKSIGEPIYPPQSNSSTNILPELLDGVSKNEVILLKTTSGTFTSTDLDHELRNLNIDILIVTGVVTNFCVEFAARQASDLGYTVFVVTDACAAWSSSLHNSSIKTIELLYGDSITTKNLIKQMQKKLEKK